MTLSIGDLATSFSNRAANTRLRSELNTLARNLTTGQKSDLHTPLSGDLAPVVVIARRLTTLAAHDTVIRESSLFITGVQNALAQVSGGLDRLAQAAVDMENTDNPALVASFAGNAAESFGALINTLNGTIGGRALFAGADTDGQAVDTADLLLDDLMAALPPAARAQDVSDTVDAYFAAGGGFETTRYLGSPAPLAPFRVTPDDALSMDVRADTEALRRSLGAMAKAALLHRGALDGDPGQARALIRTAGLDMLSATAGVAALSGDVGIVEGRMEESRTRNATEKATLDMAMAALVAADPFETATRLTEVQTQLETFYLVTARLSQLSLAGALR